MASRQHNIICVMFDKIPEGTHFTVGTYSWVNLTEGLAYIKDGYGKEYDPAKSKIHKPKPETPEDDYPENFPDAIKNILTQAGKDWKAVQKLAEKGRLKTVPGIGKSTEHKIKQYLEGK